MTYVVVEPGDLEDEPLTDKWAMSTEGGVLVHRCHGDKWAVIFTPDTHGYVCPGCSATLPEHLELIARIALEDA